MPRRVIAQPSFHASVAALPGTPETVRVTEALVQRATSHPENAPVLSGTNVRALRSRSYGAFPALRLFYSVDAEAVYLLRIDQYEELTPEL